MNSHRSTDVSVGLRATGTSAYGRRLTRHPISHERSNVDLRPSSCRSKPVAAADGSREASAPRDVRSDPYDLQRRAVLAGLTVGGMHAWAGRSMQAGAVEEAAAASGATAGRAVYRGSQELLQELEKRVDSFELPNGLRVIVLQRRAAGPVVSCMTYANTGAYDEQTGQTGIAHLLEHMAFKGTRRVGTSDARAEALLLNSLDEVFYELRDLKGDAAASGDEAVGARVKQLERQFRDLQTRADALSVPNEFGTLLQRAGATGLNAATSHDSTRYFVSLPANKLELWFALEAERFQAPVFRELYTEKRVVAEERSLRVDAAPIGLYSEQFNRAAIANNYGRPVIGYQRDVDALGRHEVEAFFRRYYGPRSVTLAIVGDVDADQARAFAERYFGPWQQQRVGQQQQQQQEADPSLTSAEASAASASGRGSASAAAGAGPGQGGGDDSARPPANRPMELRGSSRAGPLLYAGYYRPSATSALEDSVALDVISDLLSGGRSSPFYRGLVQGGKALAAQAIAAYPADKHPCMFFTYGVPVPGRTLQQLAGDMFGEARKLAESGGLTEADLERVKKSNRVDLLNLVRSNSSMANLLASYSAVFGDWREVARELALLEQMDVATVKRVAGQTFRPGNVFTGIVNKAP